MGNFIDSSEIGRMIKYYRLNAGMSQEALAEKVGVSHHQIRKYELGHSMLNTDRLQQVASALKIDPADFFESSNAENLSLSEREVELLRLFRRIQSAELKDSILKIIRHLNKRSS